MISKALIHYLDGDPVIFLQHAEALLADKDRQIANLDEALGRAEYEKTQLEGTVDALEERLQGYKDELRL